MENNHNFYEYAFSTMNGYGRRLKWDLLEHYTPEEILHLPEEEIKKFFTLKEWNRYLRCRMHYNIEETRLSYQKMQEKGIEFIYCTDDRYPARLANIPDKPLGLFCKGKLSDMEKAVAIVGARTCTAYGREMACYFARELAKEGVAIISGLASGIDVAAHRGALNADGVTVGVLGCGADIVYPKENYYVCEKMQKKGAVLSEYDLGEEPAPWRFPERNRIISGLADGILVVEAKKKSGSLITADCALEQGRDIFAIPGRILDSYSEGCNWLIREGATMVTDPGHVLEELYSSCKETEKELRKSDKLLETKEKIVYDCLSLEPKSVEDIICETNLTVSECISILFRLELKKYIKQIVKDYYILSL